MWRDFTFVDDVVRGTIAFLDRPPRGNEPHRLCNIAGDRREKVALEELIGKKSDAPQRANAAGRGRAHPSGRIARA
jgi:UDP-glucuronate 4-epimerase